MTNEMKESDMSCGSGSGGGKSIKARNLRKDDLIDGTQKVILTIQDGPRTIVRYFNPGSAIPQVTTFPGSLEVRVTR